MARQSNRYGNNIAITVLSTADFGYLRYQNRSRAIHGSGHISVHWRLFIGFCHRAVAATRAFIATNFIDIGRSPSRILAGVMLVTFFVSMWISNTATVMMFLSAVTSLIVQLDKRVPQASGSIAIALLLGLAYAASIGGMATPVGTPTNMIFVSYFAKTYPMPKDSTSCAGSSLAFPLLCYS